MSFKIGDEVKIAKDSKWYNANKYNPRGVGEVIQVTEEFEYAYEVKWSEGLCNVYREEDLVEMFDHEDYELKEAKKSLDELIELCHGEALRGGWWNDINTGDKLDRNKGELIALIHSEVSEALEGVRKDCMDDKLPHRKMEEVELADTIIRILDYAGGFGLDVGGALLEKIEYNKNREDHKPENRMKIGGKKL